MTLMCTCCTMQPQHWYIYDQKCLCGCVDSEPALLTCNDQWLQCSLPAHCLIDQNLQQKEKKCAYKGEESCSCSPTGCSVQECMKQHVMQPPATLCCFNFLVYTLVCTIYRRHAGISSTDQAQSTSHKRPDAEHTPAKLRDCVQQI